MLAVFLCGCSPKKMIEIAVEDFTEPSDHEYADVRMQELITAIEEEDKEAIESLFSTVAKEETEDLNEGMEFLFAFIQGDCLSIDQTGQHVSEVNARWTRMETFFDVNTTEGEYFFIVVDQKKDRENPENEGVYSLRAMTKEDTNTEFYYWRVNEVPGIYIPEE